jgi:ribonucleoside-diphosphate reductase alpha chain
MMGLADYYLLRGVAYGSDQSLEELSFILGFMKTIAEDESIELGKEKGIPKMCKLLPVPRRNVTLISIAPTGSLSLLAGCSSGIEPIFSEIMTRKDKTGTYNIEHPLHEEKHFRCAVSANGSTEVTWKEHILIQSTAQKFVDSGLSKTINFPNHTHKDTFYDAFILAWKLGCKGITAYRNDSRKEQVLSPKNLKRDKCPLCESELIEESGCKKCSNVMCGFSLCTIG